jgi:hypothetical protein
MIGSRSVSRSASTPAIVMLLSTSLPELHPICTTVATKVAYRPQAFSPQIAKNAPPPAGFHGQGWGKPRRCG